MEKRFFLFFVFSFIFLFSFARTDNQQVEMARNGMNNNNHFAVVPEVTYNPSENTISVEFEAEGSFTLMVKDVDGQVIYSAPVVTNGNSYSYDVNLLPENYYVITITSVDDGYIGVLETETE